MMGFKAIIFTLVFIAIAEVISEEECPDGLPSEPFTPEEVRKIRRETTSNLWSNEICLSEDAELLRDQLLAMSTSDDDNWNIFSSVATMWLSASLPHLDTAPPNWCTFAQMINTIPSWDEASCYDDLSPIMRKVFAEMHHRSLAGISSALANSGCGKIIIDEDENVKILSQSSEETGPDPLTKFALTDTCEGDGLVYDIESMLDYMGDTYSDVPDTTEDIKCILRRLYDSDCLQDNVIALLTLASAAPPMKGGIVNTSNNEIKFTFFRLVYLQSCSVPQCCCKKYRQDLRDVYTKIPPHLDTVLSNAFNSNE